MDAKWLRNSFVYLVILVLLLAVAYSFVKGNSSEKGSNLSQIVTYIRQDVHSCLKKGSLDTVTVDGTAVKLQRAGLCQGPQRDLHGAAWLERFIPHDPA